VWFLQRSLPQHVCKDTPEVEATVTTENDESSAEKTEETSSTTVAVKERSQGIYASEASRPMTLEEMFERQREEERNTPEFLAKAEKSYQESKRWWIEHCRLKGIPHELETEPETLPPSEVARFKEKTKRVWQNIYDALVSKGNK
jgi:hypothetical protein